MESTGNYHGIVIDVSQKNNSVLKSLEIIGKQKVFLNLVSLLKVSVPAVALEETIKMLQGNMRKRLWPLAKSFYFHLYNEAVLIVVFKEKIFRIKPDKSEFGEIIKYGRTNGIPENQLDFIPYRFQDEDY